MLPRLLAILLLSASPAAAALEWETTRVTHRAAPEEDAVEGVFPFRNAGDTTITISNVSSSCGCTVPALDKRTYPPGESGKIVAKFTFGDRLGRQVKTISVTTDEPGSSATVLTLDVEVPEIISIRPRFLLWRRGEAVTEKTIEVRVLEPESVDDLTVRAPDERFSARLEPTDTPGAYRVIITPRDTEMATNASFRLTAKIAGAERSLTIFAGVR